MRSAGLLAAVLLLAALPAHAEDAQPALQAEDWPLLPINELEREELARKHEAVVGQATRLAQRIGRLKRMRAERADPEDSGGVALGRQIDGLRERLAPLLRQAIDALDDPVIDDALLARIRSVPPGPLREVRHTKLNNVVLRVHTSQHTWQSMGENAMHTMHAQLTVSRHQLK